MSREGGERILLRPTKQGYTRFRDKTPPLPAENRSLTRGGGFVRSEVSGKTMIETPQKFFFGASLARGGGFYQAGGFLQGIAV